MYSQQELSDIRKSIEFGPDDVPLLEEKQRMELLAALHDKKVKEGPFMYLYFLNREHYERLEKDPIASQFHLLAFLPETYPLFYESDTLPEVKAKQSKERGLIALIQHPTRSIIVKETKNLLEHRIAEVAGNLGVGPKQFQSCRGFLTEEYIKGYLFPSLVETCRPENFEEFFHQTGVSVGGLLRKLHDGGILYNNIILCGPQNKSHLIIGEKTQLVDFSTAVVSQEGLLRQDIQRLYSELPLIGSDSRPFLKGLTKGYGLEQLALFGFQDISGSKLFH